MKLYRWFFLVAGLGLVGTTRAATITLGAVVSPTHQFTLGGVPVSAITITAGDSVVLDSSVTSLGGAILVSVNCAWMDPNWSFPVTQTFLIPGSYRISDLSPGASCSGGSCYIYYYCSVNNIDVTVLPPPYTTSPPCPWVINGPAFLADGTYNLCSLDIQPGGVLYTYGAVTLNISGGLTVESGGRILGSGLGYPGEGWPGTPGPGTGSSSLGSGSGGGHAGPGGDKFYEWNEIDYRFQGGGPYDNAAAPSLPGSGGGNGRGPLGGNGGAALIIQDLAGTVRLDGTLDLSGTKGSDYALGGTNDIANAAGGGAGGSVYIQAKNLLGAGGINADGGAGGLQGYDDDYDVYGGGGGSGGFITFCVTNSDTYSGTVSVSGGYSSASDGAPGIFTHSSICDPVATFVTFTPTFTYTPLPTDTPTPCYWGCTSTFTPTPTDSPTTTPSGTPTLTATATLTSSPTRTLTVTPTRTPSPTPTVTSTFTASSTDTPLCVTHLWPDPFNPAHAVEGKLKIGCVPPGSRVVFYTLSGELVRQVTEDSQLAKWDGLNSSGAPAAAGIYFYVVLSGNRPIERGKFLLVR